MRGVLYKLLGCGGCVAFLALPPALAPARQHGDSRPGRAPAAGTADAAGGSGQGRGQGRRHARARRQAAAPGAGASASDGGDHGRGQGRAQPRRQARQARRQQRGADGGAPRRLTGGSMGGEADPRPQRQSGPRRPAADAPAPVAAPAPAPAATPPAPSTPATAPPAAPLAKAPDTAPTPAAADTLSGARPGGAGLSRPAGGDPFAPLPAAMSRERGERAGGLRRPRPARRDPVTRTVVRTVERVAEVVPGFVWALIGVLSAIALAGAAASSLIAARARRLRRQREALLRDVGLLQEALLPDAPEQVAGAAASVAYRPAAGDRAGSDFYDVFAIDERRLGIVVGRVSAGGRRALGVTAHIRHVLRAYLEGGLRPRNALQVGADVLENHLGPDYACVAVAVHDAETSELTWAGAGMPAPVVAGATAFEPVTVGAAPPLGMGVTTGTRQTTLVLPPGGQACLYTDGVTDAVVGGERYGYRRLWRAVEELDAGEGAEALLRRVASESAGSPGEMAAVLLRAGPQAPAEGEAGERRVEELELAARDLAGERPALFLRDCGVPTSRLPELLEELRDEGRRLGGVVLRVHVGPGVPEADVALRSMDVLHAPSAGRGEPVPDVSAAPGRSG